MLSDSIKLINNKFISHLFGMDKRIYAYDMIKNPLHKYNDLPAYVVSKNRIAIPGFSIPEFEHEIAHFVEMRNFNRLLLPDFGMEAFHDCPNKRKLFSALSREIRVRTLVDIIKERNFDSRSFTREILGHCCWGVWAERSIPFGKFDEFPQSEITSEYRIPISSVYSENNKLIQWIEKLYQTTWKAWSLSRIEYEWNVRLSFIQNWMETAV